MPTIPYPSINGITEDERIKQINDYLGKYSSSLSNSYNNIGIDNLNQSLAEKINKGISHHQPLDLYAPVKSVEESSGIVDDGLEDVENMLEERHRDGYVLSHNDMQYYEPKESLNNLYSISDMRKLFYNKTEFENSFVKSEGLKKLSTLEILLGWGVSGFKSKLKELERKILELEQARG